MLKKCTDAISLIAQDLKVLKAFVGLGFIAVQLEDTSMGLCVNITPTGSTGCTVYSRGGTLAGLRVKDILNLSGEPDFISRGLALAAVNALASTMSSPRTGDVLEHIQIREGMNTVIVGFIEPIAALLTSKGCKVTVFENAPKEHPLIQPVNMMPRRLEEAEVVIVTGTALINDTLREILTLIKPASKVIVVGPSTPMLPAVFSDTGITYLAGACIVDPDMAFTILMEGGGTKALYRSGALKKAYSEVS
jgi:uncharacterized protein (DUF4213/DUF364 family)